MPLATPVFPDVITLPLLRGFFRRSLISFATPVESKAAAELRSPDVLPVWRLISSTAADGACETAADNR
jgi:hypothetical protein